MFELQEMIQDLACGPKGRERTWVLKVHVVFCDPFMERYHNATCVICQCRTKFSQFVLWILSIMYRVYIMAAQCVVRVVCVTDNIVQRHKNRAHSPMSGIYIVSGDCRPPRIFEIIREPIKMSVHFLIE